MNGDGSGAADGAGEAALVGDVELFRKTLTADHFKIFKLTGGVVPGGEESPHLHGADQTGGSKLRQLVAGEGVTL